LTCAAPLELAIAIDGWRPRRSQTEWVDHASTVQQLCPRHGDTRVAAWIADRPPLAQGVSAPRNTRRSTPRGALERDPLQASLARHVCRGGQSFEPCWRGASGARRQPATAPIRTNRARLRLCLSRGFTAQRWSDRAVGPHPVPAGLGWRGGDLWRRG